MSTKQQNTQNTLRKKCHYKTLCHSDGTIISFDKLIVYLIVIAQSCTENHSCEWTSDLKIVIITIYLKKYTKKSNLY
jgi:hypothetical protein